MSQFKDHFSGHAGVYTQYRPVYPNELFTWLAGLPKGRKRAWDCATGNGQAAFGLVEHFDEVIATDASANQIAETTPVPGLKFGVAPAEDSGLEDGSIDLITVAQAIHWFDHDRFYAEAARVAAPGAVLAVFAYGLLQMDPPIQQVIDDYYRMLDPWWPPERAIVDSHYSILPFPFPLIEPREVVMTTHWTLDHLVGYFGTWSAGKHYQRERGEDPTIPLREKLAQAWATGETVKTVRWPLFFRIGKLNQG